MNYGGERFHKMTAENTLTQQTEYHHRHNHIPYIYFFNSKVSLHGQYKGHSKLWMDVNNLMLDQTDSTNLFHKLTIDNTARSTPKVAEYT